MDIFAGEVGPFVLGALPYILLAALVLFFVLGGILDYHWRTYGIGFLRLPIFRIIYVGLGALLLFIMISAFFGLSA
jgi:hypothetical protein